jgi:hypothetical protein
VEDAVPTSMFRGWTTLLAASVAVLTVVGCSGGDDQSGPSTDSGAGGHDAPSEEAAADSTTPDGNETGSGDAGPEDASSDGSLDASTSDGGDAGDGGDCVPGSVGEPTELRCTGLYSDWTSKTVSADVHEYDPGLHLWSDGAVKTRWIYLPPAQDGGVAPIDTTDMDEWTFPVGTKIWKEFVLGGVRIETRLLWKMTSSYWYPTTYKWSADGSTSTSELTDGELNATDAGYEIPSQQKCQECHEGRSDYVLGFEAVSLSSPNATISLPSAGDAGVAIDTLKAQGWLSAPPATHITIPGTAIEAAALGYLHANCGIACHNAGSGLASGTGFHMRLDVATLSTVETTDTWTTGWNVATRGFALVPERLAQCSTAESCVYYRMNHRDGLDDAATGTQMPPIDSHEIDEQGLATVAAWINEGCTDAGASDAGHADAGH